MQFRVEELNPFMECTCMRLKRRSRWPVNPQKGLQALSEGKREW